MSIATAPVTRWPFAARMGLASAASIATLGHEVERAGGESGAVPRTVRLAPRPGVHGRLDAGGLALERALCR
jgi:hypothetical protein